MAFIVASIVGAAGAIGGGLIAAHGASSAANAQASAADNAAQLQSQEAANALAFQERVYGDQQKNLAPYYQAGTGALSNLDNLLGITPGPAPAGAASSASTANPNLPGGNFTPSPFNVRGPNAGNFDIPQQQPLSRLQAINNSTVRGPITIDGAPGTLRSMPNSAGIVPARVPGQPGGINDAAGTSGGNGFDPKFVNGQPVGTAPLGTPGNPIPESALPGQTTVASGNPGGGFGSLLQPYSQSFVPPDSVTEQNDPGYQFRLNQGIQTLDNSAAARGDLLSGNTGEALTQFGQDYASNEYNNVYNRALQNYQTGFNAYNIGQDATFNRLAAIAGLGQTATGQLNSAGVSAANNVAGIDLGAGAQIGGNINNAGAARASGYVGTSNAIGGAVSGLGGNLSQLSLLSNILGQGGGASTAGGSFDPSLDGLSI